MFYHRLVYLINNRDGFLRILKKPFNSFTGFVDHLGALATFRAKKIAGAVGYDRLSNMLPQEAVYYDAIQAATNELMGAWGVE